jgi:hypothetical protein
VSALGAGVAAGAARQNGGIRATLTRLAPQVLNVITDIADTNFHELYAEMTRTRARPLGAAAPSRPAPPGGLTAQIDHTTSGLDRSDHTPFDSTLQAATRALYTF